MKWAGLLIRRLRDMPSVTRMYVVIYTVFKIACRSRNVEIMMLFLHRPPFNSPSQILYELEPTIDGWVITGGGRE